MPACLSACMPAACAKLFFWTVEGLLSSDWSTQQTDKTKRQAGRQADENLDKGKRGVPET